MGIYARFSSMGCWAEIIDDGSEGVPAVNIVQVNYSNESTLRREVIIVSQDDVDGLKVQRVGLDPQTSGIMPLTPVLIGARISFS